MKINNTPKTAVGHLSVNVGKTLGAPFMPKKEETFKNTKTGQNSPSPLSQWKKEDEQNLKYTILCTKLADLNML